MRMRFKCGWIVLAVWLWAGGSAKGQTYLFGGLDAALFKPKSINSMLEGYNARNKLWLRTRFPRVGSIGGFTLGVGNYTERLMLELRIGSQRVSRLSDGFEPGGFFVERNIRWAYHFASLGMGFRPFPDRYLSVGMSLNGGNLRSLVSEGSDFQELESSFSFSTDIFADLTLLNSPPYLLRIRPYYRLFFNSTSLKNVDVWLNGPYASAAPLAQPFNHGGGMLSFCYILGGGE